MAISMIDSPEIRQLGKFLDLSAMRTELITSNMANVDTPQYQTRDINFRQEMERALDDSPFAYASFSPMVREVRGLAVRPDGNNVSLEREGLLLADTQLKFQAAVQVLTAEFHRILSAIHEGGTSS
ncbi:MAG TPA: flagellar basal body rod protein FlgB [Terriglobales bacterium]|nr:flagellar basal body rod protein FlgB [Terriglobales bacterium]